MNLDIGDAAELVELLQFAHDWLATDADHIDESLSGFVGNCAYDTRQLRADLNRFTILLGGSDGDAELGDVRAEPGEVVVDRAVPSRCR